MHEDFKKGTAYQPINPKLLKAKVANKLIEQISKKLNIFHIFEATIQHFDISAYIPNILLGDFEKRKKIYWNNNSIVLKQHNSINW